jgi:hypothetical protein
VPALPRAFLAQFNGLQPSVYSRFHAVLCRDLADAVAGGRDETQAGPHMFQSGAAASTRIGFSCMPLLCLVVRSVGQVRRRARGRVRARRKGGRARAVRASRLARARACSTRRTPAFPSAH